MAMRSCSTTTGTSSVGAESARSARAKLSINSLPVRNSVSTNCPAATNLRAVSVVRKFFNSAAPFSRSADFRPRSINDAREQTFRVERFGHTDEDGMVARLRPLLYDLDAGVCICGGGGEHLLKHLFGHVVGTGAGDERAARFE